jgi:hypothetical protein
MATTKPNAPLNKTSSESRVEPSVNIEINSTYTFDEQLIAALSKKQPQIVELEVDEYGNVVVDKDLHPNIYEWATKG